MSAVKLPLVPTVKFPLTLLVVPEMMFVAPSSTSWVKP